MTPDIWKNSILRKMSIYSEVDLSGSKILILVGSLSISGGTNLILNYANSLQNSGAEVSIGYMLGEASDSNWHPFGHKFRRIPIKEISGEFFDLGIATWWPTVERILEVHCGKYLYFVQSLESRFALNYSNDSDRYSAAATYMLGFPVITIASWLHNLIMTQTQSKSWLVKNGIDKNLFPIVEPIKQVKQHRQPLRVLVEGSLGVPMKANDETINALREIDGIETWHVGPKGSITGDVDKQIGSVELNKMAAVYSNIDVLVKMSRVEGMFAPPLEAFHCGATAIVSKVTGYDEYVRHERNALVVEVDDFEELRFQVERLRDNPQLLFRLRENATATAVAWPDITQTSLEFANICYSIMCSSNLGSIDRDSTSKLLKHLKSDPFSISPLLTLD